MCFCFKGAATPIKPDDFRNEFDYLLVQWSHERIAEMENFLLHLTQHIETFKASPNAEEKERLLNEVNLVLGNTVGIHQFFEEELKRTDLNLLEKYIFGDGKISVEMLQKSFEQAEKEIEAVVV